MKKNTLLPISSMIISVMMSTFSTAFAMEAEGDNMSHLSGTQSTTTQNFAEAAASQTPSVVYSSIPRTSSFFYERDKMDGESKSDFLGRVDLGYYPVISQSVEVADNK